MESLKCTSHHSVFIVASDVLDLANKDTVPVYSLRYGTAEYKQSVVEDACTLYRPDM